MNKNVFLWGLYDFANTPLTAAIGGLYLAQWVVLDNHIDDIWYGGVFALATILLLITSPFWGAWSDYIGRRMPFISAATVILLVFGSLLGIFAVSSLPPFTRVVLVLILFFGIQYFYQISLIFYNTLLTQLSTPRTVGKISGIGDVFSEVGWLLGPAILLPFATKQITLFGEPGRGQVFFPAVIIFAVLGLPMIFWLKEPRPKSTTKKISFRAVYDKTIQGLKFLIKKDRNTGTSLVAFMFVSDALLTATLYFAIYLDQVFGIGDTQKYLALALLEIAAIPSAYIFGRLSDKFGVKKLLILSCLDLVVAFTLLALSSSLIITYILCFLIGIGFAGFYVTARALLIKISPAERYGEYFGIYSTFQNFASIIGPLIWGIVTLLLKDYGPVRYRIAALSLTVLVGLGTFLFTRVQEKIVLK